MKKILTVFAFIAMFIAASNALFSGTGGLNNNQSAEFIKTLNRSASTDVDAAFYNPAATAFMEQGLHFYLSNQSVYMPVEIRGSSLTRSVYRGMKWAHYMPTLYMVYKKNKLGPGNFAWSLGLMAIGGGGEASFPKGLQHIDVSLTLLGSTVNGLYTMLGLGAPIGTLVTTQFGGQSTYYGPMTSFAYSFLKDKMAISLGYRVIYGVAYIDAKIYSNGAYFPLIPGSINYHARQNGVAHGAILGISSKPIKTLTIGFKLEYNSPLRLKTRASNDLILGIVDSGMKNGGTAHKQLPANANIGIAYRIKGLQIAWSFSYYLNQFAQWNGIEDNFNGGWETGIGFDYTLKNIPLNIGCGYGHTYTGARPSARNQIDEHLDIHSVAAGFTYSIKKNIKLTLSHTFAYFVPVDVNKRTYAALFPAEYHKTSYVAAFGIEYKVE